MRRILLSVFLMSMVCLTALGTNIKEFLKPYKLDKMVNNAIVLNGKWQFQYQPESKWETILVPGEAAMQGYALEHDKVYTYRKSVSIPSYFKGKRVLLRFDGVYSHAKLFVNGTCVREHHGGFTRWEADITTFIKCGANNEIMLEVTDCLDDVSYGSGYAHHTIGGILRDVMLYAVDNNISVANFAIETLLDSAYKDATLRLKYNAYVNGNGAQLKAVLRNGSSVVKEQTFDIGNGDMINEIAVENPQKWDAEHPNLYTLDITLMMGGVGKAYYSKNVGFRAVEIQGNKMFVNGKQVKLRGSCRHDVHPTLGRTTDAYLDSVDVVLLKRSNQNFVRTSHYPPTERFVEFCDKMGIYVECETAICFINTHGQKNYAKSRSAMHSCPEYTDRILGQLKEMVATHRNHPSVIFWSIGNESSYGANFQKSYDWIKAEDSTRPAIFSYPGSVPAGVKCYDIASMHYQDVHGNLNQWGVRSFGYQVDGYPAIFDEWAHVPCYTYATLRDDPNIREFWGQSLDKMWSGTFSAPGGLGGAIWGYIDETFMIPTPKKGAAFWKEFAHTAKPDGFRGNAVGYGEWGIIDVWRREKPEFWGTKKAYSPIKLETKIITAFMSGMPLNLNVYNRFDHTYLNEVEVEYSYNGQLFKGKMANIAPHKKGVISVPAQNWEEGNELLVKFMDKEGELIDAYNVLIGKKLNIRVSDNTTPIKIGDDNDFTIIEGNNFKIPFNKITGLIENATSRGTVVIEKGPFLHIDVNYNHLTGAEVRSKARNFILDDKLWKKEELKITKDGNNVKCVLKGNYDNIAVEMVMTVNNNGKLDVYYQVNDEPNGYLRESGLKFILPDNFTTLEWERNGYWSYYPEESFAANKGNAPLYNKKVPKYGANPNQPWQMDTHNYYYWSDSGAPCEKPLTQWAKGMKENIYYYGLKAPKGGIAVVSDNGAVACRLNKHANDYLTLYINKRWDYPEIAWGGYCKAEALSPTYGSISILLD
ncbi:MAG: glycoside hydrolase family 2 TIM barrel-domain containing protein [Marinifilaceae bacterium]